MSRCQSFTDRGTPCQMRARIGSAHCISHDPDYRDTARANAVAGGVASGEARRVPGDALHIPGFSLGDRRHIQLILDAVLRMDLAGRIEPGRSRRVIKALSIAVRNFDRPGREKELDPMHFEHDFSDIAGEVAEFEAAFPGWAYNAAEGDQLRSDLQLANASKGRKRQATDYTLYPNIHPGSRSTAHPDPHGATVDNLLNTFSPNDVSLSPEQMISSSLRMPDPPTTDAPDDPALTFLAAWSRAATEDNDAEEHARTA